MIQTPYGQFPDFYRVEKLKDLCVDRIGIQTGPFGSQLHNSDYVSTGTPILTVEHLGENRIIHNNIPKVTDEDRDRLSQYLIKKGDIIFSRVGSVDRRALVRDEEDGWLFSGRCLRVRPDPEKLDSVYLSYLMGLPSFKEYIRKIAVGATMPSINTEILSNIPISYPSLPIQYRIAQILSSFDDKIELNRQMNITLEAIARALFQSWFVDFDPVRAKAEDRQPEGMDAATAALFPGGFEVVEGREVPKGWGVGTLGKIMEFAYGEPLKEDDRRGGSIPVYGSNGQIGWHDEKLVKGPGIIVGRKGNPGLIHWSATDFFPIDTTFYVVPKSKDISLYYLYHELQRQDLPSLSADSAVPGLNRNIAYLSSMIIPTSKIFEKFDELMIPIYDIMQNAKKQSHSLTHIRDTLLPKLMSGELPVHGDKK